MSYEPQVGMLVECLPGTWVTNDEQTEAPGTVDPRPGQILRIRSISTGTDGLYLRFDELWNPSGFLAVDGGYDFLTEAEYHYLCFRPLPDERLSIFRRALVSPKKKVEA